MYLLKKNYYDGIAGIYFEITINSIIKIGNLDRKGKKILDFGCGYGILKKKLKNKVYNYDINPKLTEYKSWRKLKFDYIVINQVLYLFHKKELERLLKDLKKINPNLMLIVGISYQNLLSKILAFLLGYKKAHDFTKLSYKDQINILNKECILIKKKNNYLNAILLLKFKE